MIELSTLTESVQELLNSKLPTSSGNEKYEFRIFADTGDFVKAARNGNTVTNYINGIMEIVQSSMAPQQGLIIATQTARLQVIVGLEDAETLAVDKTVEVCRNVLSRAFESPMSEVLTDESGTSFNVAVYGMPPTTGERMQSQILGDCFSFTVYIYYSFIENGLNSLNCTFQLDGITLAYSSVNIARVPTLEADIYSDESGNSKNRLLASSLQFTFSLPATANQLSAAYMTYLLTGVNPVMTLTVNLKGTTQSYSVIFGQTELASSGIQNAGMTVTLVEAVDYGDL